MGRVPAIVTKQFTDNNGKTIKKQVELFTWEKLDYVKLLKEKFKI
jgi:S-adenosylmethionine synthetase